METNRKKDINTLVEMSVFKINPYLSTERPLLWLCEKGVQNPRLLPIAIGEFEAAAIQIKLHAKNRCVLFATICSSLWWIV